MADETEKGRLDRELIELLNELRVVLPGIQVLFAFLLIVPFTDRFPILTSGERAVYYVAAVATAISTLLLVSPTAQHRVRWRSRDKARLLHRSNQLAIAGMVFLLVAMAASVFVVVEVVYDNAVAEVTAAVLAVAMGWFWFGEPLARRVQEGDDR